MMSYNEHPDLDTKINQGRYHFLCQEIVRSRVTLFRDITSHRCNEQAQEYYAGTETHHYCDLHAKEAGFCCRCLEFKGEEVAYESDDATGFCHRCQAEQDALNNAQEKESKYDDEAPLPF